MLRSLHFIVSLSFNELYDCRYVHKLACIRLRDV